MSRPEKSLIEAILSEPCVDAYIRYLGAFKVVESDYGLFDKLARPRDIEDFTLTVYSSVRVQERVLKRLQEGIQSGDFEVIGNVGDVGRAFRIGKDCLSKVIELARHNPRFVGSVIASLALAYEGVKSKR
ncbi:MAG: hypothetical protein N3E47_05385 [Candidatus Bathyarchaeota archaeon]|nr:hypothetical protein [Candidatus Bathyarchaeota archaeon]